MKFYAPVALNLGHWERLQCIASFFSSLLKADLTSNLLLRICCFLFMKESLLLMNVRIRFKPLRFIFKINHSVL